jgi:hypothetical protein
MHGLQEENYLKWNEAATSGSQGAQSWADRGQFAHSSCYQLPAPAGPAGENLASASAGWGGDPNTRVDSWYSEVNDCDWRTGCQRSTNGKATGHFTALIWKDASELACANAPGGSGTIFVCRYLSPAGVLPNMGGAYDSEVMKLSASASEGSCREKVEGWMAAGGWTGCNFDSSFSSTATSSNTEDEDGNFSNEWSNEYSWGDQKQAPTQQAPTQQQPTQQQLPTEAITQGGSSTYSDSSTYSEEYSVQYYENSNEQPADTTQQGRATKFRKTGSFFRVSATVTGTASAGLVSDVSVQTQYSSAIADLLGVDRQDVQAVASDDSGTVIATALIVALSDDSFAAISSQIYDAGFSGSLDDAVGAGMHDIDLDERTVAVDTIAGDESISNSADDDELVRVPLRVIKTMNDATTSTATTSTATTTEGSVEIDPNAAAADAAPPAAAGPSAATATSAAHAGVHSTWWAAASDSGGCELPEGVQYALPYALALGDETALGDLSCARSNALCGLVVSVQCGTNAAINAVITSVCNKGSGTCGVDLVGNAWDAATGGASPGIEDCTVTLTDGTPIAGSTPMCAQRPSAVAGNSQWYTSVGMFNVGKPVVSATLGGISGTFNGDSNYFDFQASGGVTFGADAPLVMTFDDGTTQTLNYGGCTTASSTHIFGGSTLRMKAESQQQQQGGRFSPQPPTHLNMALTATAAVALLSLVALAAVGQKRRQRNELTQGEITTPTASSLASL